METHLQDTKGREGTNKCESVATSVGAESHDSCALPRRIHQCGLNPHGSRMILVWGAVGGTGRGRIPGSRANAYGIASGFDPQHPGSPSTARNDSCAQSQEEPLYTSGCSPKPKLNKSKLNPVWKQQGTRSARDQDWNAALGMLLGAPVQVPRGYSGALTLPPTSTPRDAPRQQDARSRPTSRHLPPEIVRRPPPTPGNRGRRTGPALD